jgi:5-methylcytosine-specific restriction endonuclease McrA
MPIKADLKPLYPKDWPAISLRTRAKAGFCCEGSPAYPDCRAKASEPHPVTGSIVVLTVGHRDHNPRNNDPSNLASWCQRCHLAHDQEHHKRNAFLTRRSKKALGDLFELLPSHKDTRPP